MPASKGFCDLMLEVLSPLGPVRIKRMFGGAGIWHGDTMFAIIADDTLYLKAGDKTRADFEAEGLSPFAYTGKSRAIELPYWHAPERLLDEPDEMRVWAAKAIEVAYAAQTRKRQPRATPSSDNQHKKKRPPRRTAKR